MIPTPAQVRSASTMPQLDGMADADLYPIIDTAHRRLLRTCKRDWSTETRYGVSGQDDWIRATAILVEYSVANSGDRRYDALSPFRTEIIKGSLGDYTYAKDKNTVLASTDEELTHIIAFWLAPTNDTTRISVEDLLIARGPTKEFGEEWWRKL